MIAALDLPSLHTHTHTDWIQSIRGRLLPSNVNQSDSSQSEPTWNRHVSGDARDSEDSNIARTWLTHMNKSYHSVSSITSFRTDLEGLIAFLTRFLT